MQALQLGGVDSTLTPEFGGQVVTQQSSIGSYAWEYWVITVVVVNLKVLTLGATSVGLGVLMVITIVGLGTVKIYPIIGMLAVLRAKAGPAAAAVGVYVKVFWTITFPWRAIIYYITGIVVLGKPKKGDTVLSLSLTKVIVTL